MSKAGDGKPPRPECLIGPCLSYAPGRNGCNYEVCHGPGACKLDDPERLRRFEAMVERMRKEGKR